MYEGQVKIICVMYYTVKDTHLHIISCCETFMQPSWLIQASWQRLPATDVATKDGEITFSKRLSSFDWWFNKIIHSIFGH